MKALVVNTYDGQGGAARAALRLHRSLRETGIDARMLVASRTEPDASISAVARSRYGAALAGLRPLLDLQPLYSLHPNRRLAPYSVHWLPGRTTSRINALAPDIVNLHWINAGFVRIESLGRIRAPLVWTLHDMWAFTGGCHYDAGCGKYTDVCRHCPQLRGTRDKDLSHWIWQRKRKAWRDLPLQLVTPSRWLAERATASALLGDRDVRVIANGIDLSKFRPVDSRQARSLLDLPQHKKLVGFGGMSPLEDPRKGFAQLRSALRALAERGATCDIELVVFGAIRPPEPLDLGGVEAHFLGVLRDDLTLALAYSAADVFAAPSLQDNLPNTVMEAMACGTPAVGFASGGLPELIDHEENGYLCEPDDPQGLADAIERALAPGERSRLGEAARRKCERAYSSELQAKRYLDLFHEVLERARADG